MAEIDPPALRIPLLIQLCGKHLRLRRGVEREESGGEEEEEDEEE